MRELNIIIKPEMVKAINDHQLTLPELLESVRRALVEACPHFKRRLLIRRQTAMEKAVERWKSIHD